MPGNGFLLRVYSELRVLKDARGERPTMKLTLRFLKFCVVHHCELCRAICECNRA